MSSVAAARIFHGQREDTMTMWKRAVILGALALAACRPGPPETPLEQAAARDDATGIRRLVTEGADPNAFDSQGGTALMVAGRGGHALAAEALLAAGAQADLTDQRTTGWTALMHAVHKREHDTARILLDHGAAADARTRGGVTALIMAAAYGDTEMVRLLLDHGADPRAQARGGVTALGNASGGGGLFDITDGPGLGVCHPETVRLLLARAPDLRLAGGQRTRLHLFVSWLARGRGCDEVRALLEPRRS
jgi:ankyrin repeat protein